MAASADSARGRGIAASPGSAREMWRAANADSARGRGAAAAACSTRGGGALPSADSARREGGAASSDKARGGGGAAAEFAGSLTCILSNASWKDSGADGPDPSSSWSVGQGSPGAEGRAAATDGASCSSGGELVASEATSCTCDANNGKGHHNIIRMNHHGPDFAKGMKGCMHTGTAIVPLGCFMVSRVAHLYQNRCCRTRQRCIGGGCRLKGHCCCFCC